MAKKNIYFGTPTVVGSNVGSNQGVAMDARNSSLVGTHTGFRFITAGSGSNNVLRRYDSNWVNPTNLTLLPSAPVGAQQINGLSIWNKSGNLWVVAGWSNFNTPGQAGGFLLVNGNTMAYSATYTGANGWSEGGSVRPGTDEWWGSSHGTTTIERVDLNTLTRTDSYTDDWAFNPSQTTARLQGVCWFGTDYFMCPEHDGAANPRWLFFRYDSGANDIVAYAAIFAPSVGGNIAGQGPFTSFDGTELLIAVRDNADNTLSDVASFPVNIADMRWPVVLNSASAQAANLLFWYRPAGEDGGARPKVGGWHDYSGNAYHADISSYDVVTTMLGGAAVGGYGFGLAFKGSWVETPAGFANSTKYSAATLHFYLKIDASTTGRYVVDGNLTGSNEGDFSVQTIGTNQLEIGVSTVGGGFPTFNTSVNSFTVGVPFTLTLEVSASEVRAKINGVSVGSMGAAAYRIGGNGSPIRFGAKKDGTGTLNGSIGEARFYTALNTNIATLTAPGAATEFDAMACATPTITSTNPAQVVKPVGYTLTVSDPSDGLTAYYKVTALANCAITCGGVAYTSGQYIPAATVLAYGISVNTSASTLGAASVSIAGSADTAGTSLGTASTATLNVGYYRPTTSTTADLIGPGVRWQSWQNPANGYTYAPGAESAATIIWDDNEGSAAYESSEDIFFAGFNMPAVAAGYRLSSETKVLIRLKMEASLVSQLVHVRTRLRSGSTTWSVLEPADDMYTFPASASTMSFVTDTDGLVYADYELPVTNRATLDAIKTLVDDTNFGVDIYLRGKGTTSTDRTTGLVSIDSVMILPVTERVSAGSPVGALYALDAIDSYLLDE